MTQSEILLRILYRTRKSAVSMMEKELGCGEGRATPEIEKVYWEHKKSVENLERRLNEKGTS